MSLYVESGYAESGYSEGDNPETRVILNTVPLVILTSNVEVGLTNFIVPLLIYKIDNIIIPKTYLDDEFVTPTILSNSGIANEGVFIYSDIISDIYSNSLSIEWLTYETIMLLQNLDYNISHIMYNVITNKEFVINISSIEVVEIYRGALWYNAKINYIIKE